MNNQHNRDDSNSRKFALDPPKTLEQFLKLSKLASKVAIVGICSTHIIESVQAAGTLLRVLQYNCVTWNYDVFVV